jgi:hypothetical protein
MTQPMSYRSSLIWAGQVSVHWRRWLRAHWRMTLVLSVVSFAVGWVWNMYVMAVVLEGSAPPPDSDTASMAEGHNGNALFWLLLFSVLGGLFTYAWSRGWRMFWSDVASLPGRFSAAVSASPAATLAMLLWGASISLIISTLISTAVSLALGLVLLALAGTPVGVILNFALVRAWRGLSGIVAPDAGRRLGGFVSPVMVTLGEALGLFVHWLFGGWVLGLIVGFACAVASLLLVRVAPAPRTAALLLGFSVIVGVQFLRMRGAYADDGGWSECQAADGEPCSGIGGIFAWFGSAGAGEVVARGAAGGASAAIGTVLGVGAGGAMASVAAAAMTGPLSAAQSATGTRATGAQTSGQPGSATQATGMQTTGTQTGTNAQTGAQTGPGAQTGAATQLSQSQASVQTAGQPPSSSTMDTGTVHEARVETGRPGESQVPGQSTGPGQQPVFGDIQDLLPEQPERRDREHADDGDQPRQ